MNHCVLFLQPDRFSFFIFSWNMYARMTGEAEEMEIRKDGREIFS